jgi:hypothetical protein
MQSVLGENVAVPHRVRCGPQNRLSRSYTEEPKTLEETLALREIDRRYCSVFRSFRGFEVAAARLEVRLLYIWEA